MTVDVVTPEWKWEIIPADLRRAYPIILLFLLPLFGTFFVRFAASQTTAKAFGLTIAFLSVCMYVLAGSWEETRTVNSLDYARMALTFVPLIIFDLLIRGVFRVGRSAGWFFLHFVANMFICLGTWHDLAFVLLNPHLALSPRPQDFAPLLPMGVFPDCIAAILPSAATSAINALPWTPGIAAIFANGPNIVPWAHALVITLHVYHIIAWQVTNPADLAHHIISAGLVGSAGIMWPWGRLAPAVDFFLSGLPGGIDYLLLGLLKLGKISKMTEKRINAWLNLAIRWPGLMLVMYVTMVSRVQYLEDVKSPLLVSPGACYVVLMLHGANAMYFCDRVVRNTAVSVAEEEKLVQDAKAANRSAAKARTD